MAQPSEHLFKTDQTSVPQPPAKSSIIQHLPAQAAANGEIMALTELYQQQLAELSAAHSLLLEDQEQLNVMLAPYISGNAGVLSTPDENIMLLKRGLDLRLQEFEEDCRRIQQTERRLQRRIEETTLNYDCLMVEAQGFAESRLLEQVRDQQKVISLQQHEIDELRFQRDLYTDETKRLRNACRYGYWYEEGVTRGTGHPSNKQEAALDAKPLPSLHHRVSSRQRPRWMIDVLHSKEKLTGIPENSTEGRQRKYQTDAEVRNSSKEQRARFREPRRGSSRLPESQQGKSGKAAVTSSGNDAGNILTGIMSAFTRNSANDGQARTPSQKNPKDLRGNQKSSASAQRQRRDDISLRRSSSSDNDYVGAQIARKPRKDIETRQMPLSHSTKETRHARLEHRRNASKGLSESGYASSGHEREQSSYSKRYPRLHFPREDYNRPRGNNGETEDELRQGAYSARSIRSSQEWDEPVDATDSESVHSQFGEYTSRDVIQRAKEEYPGINSRSGDYTRDGSVGDTHITGNGGHTISRAESSAFLVSPWTSTVDGQFVPTENLQASHYKQQPIESLTSRSSQEFNVRDGFPARTLNQDDDSPAYTESPLFSPRSIFAKDDTKLPQTAVSPLLRSRTISSPKNAPWAFKPAWNSPRAA